MANIKFLEITDDNFTLQTFENVKNEISIEVFYQDNRQESHVISLNEDDVNALIDELIRLKQKVFKS